MQHSLDIKHRVKIADAIKNAELKTSGEIYCIVARKSNSYYWVVLAWGMVLSLLIPALLAWFDIDLAKAIFGRFQDWSSHSNNDINSNNIYVLLIMQALIFIGATLLGRIKSLQMLLVPKPIKQQSVHKAALDQFLGHGIHQTDARTGVLIYVSLAEHMVEIVADKGIYSKVDKSVWGNAVAKILVKTKQGDIASGLIDGIDDVGAILAEHFKPAKNNENEISDSVVFI
jgi:putative membrane protein